MQSVERAAGPTTQTALSPGGIIIIMIIMIKKAWICFVQTFIASVEMQNQISVIIRTLCSSEGGR